MAFDISSLFSIKKQELKPYNEYHKELAKIDIFRALLRLRYLLLDAVFSAHPNNRPFLLPEYWLQLDYVGINRRLKYLSEERILSSLTKYDFDRFSNLQLDIGRMLEEYPQEAKKMMEYRSKVEELFITKCKG